MNVDLVRLGDWCAQDRKSVRPGEELGLRYIGLETVESNTGRLLDGALSKTPEEPQANSFSFGPEHVLYGKLRPYLNKIVVPDFRGKCSTELIPLRPADGLDRRYLAYFLRSPGTVERISERTAGARMPRADMDFVLGLQMPLPGVAEQRRIVDLLSRAEAVVRLRRQAQQKASELIPALFMDMFGDPATNPNGWPALSLSDVTLDVRNGFNPTKDAFGDGTPFITVNDLYGGLRVTAASAQRVAASQDVVAKYRLQPGDLCFVRSSVKRSGVGMVAVFDEPGDAIFGGFVIRVRLRSGIDPLFAGAMFHTPSLRKRIVDSAGTGTITNINQPALMALPVIVPPADRQGDFVRQLLAVESIQNQQAFALARAEAALGALLDQAFPSSVHLQRQRSARVAAS